MKAILVAGGKGERLRPLTNTVPKPMIEVQGKPVLEHIINHFKKYSIHEFIITLCYLPERITSYFGDGKKFDVSITYLFEDETNPLGTAGGILQAKKFISTPFFITSGDSLRDIDIADMISYHKEKKGLGTLQVYKRFGPNPKSKILFDTNMKITDFIERPTAVLQENDFVWANGFFMLFQPEFFDVLPQKTLLDFGKDIFPSLLQQKQALYAYASDGYFVDIGDEIKLMKARKTYKPTLHNVPIEK